MALCATTSFCTHNATINGQTNGKRRRKGESREHNKPSSSSIAKQHKSRLAKALNEADSGALYIGGGTRLCLDFDVFRVEFFRFVQGVVGNQHIAIKVDALRFFLAGK